MSGEQPSTVRGAVATTEQPKAVVIAREYERSFAEILPTHLEGKQFVRSALAALRRKPDLLAAANNAPDVFVNELMACAALGHVPGSKEFYLTARRSKDHGNKQVIVGLEGYRGVVQRMYRSGGCASVIVELVHEKDRFEFIRGAHKVPIHEVDHFAKAADRGDIVGGYAYAHLTTGSPSRVVVLSRDDFDAAKQNSDSGRQGKGPWVDHYPAMCLKTLAHRLEPWVPTSAEYRREALRAEAAADNVRTEAGLVEIATGEVVES